jgi:hypothetical protein
MEYLYMQSPKPTNATGVPVTLSYVDANNNTFTIGTTTTDINGQYTYLFKPNIEGPYTIKASFAGSNSYFSSTAQTPISYMSPATATPTATPQPASAADLYFIPMSIIILVVLGIIAVMLALVMRRRP